MHWILDCVPQAGKILERLKLWARHPSTKIPLWVQPSVSMQSKLSFLSKVSEVMPTFCNISVVSVANFLKRLHSLFLNKKELWFPEYDEQTICSLRADLKITDCWVICFLQPKVPNTILNLKLNVTDLQAFSLCAQCTHMDVAFNGFYQLLPFF